MKYDLPLDSDVAKAVYALGRFDAEYAGDYRAFNKLMNYLNKKVQSGALSVCTEQHKDQRDDSKAFDRGYVKGVHAVAKFLLESYSHGEELLYMNEPKTPVTKRIV